MSDEWNNMQELNNLAANQDLLIKKYVSLEDKTSNTSSIFITLLDITEENIKNNIEQLRRLNVDEICKNIQSFRDRLRFGLLEGILNDLK